MWFVTKCILDNCVILILHFLKKSCLFFFKFIRENLVGFSLETVSTRSLDIMASAFCASGAIYMYRGDFISIVAGE